MEEGREERGQQVMVTWEIKAREAGGNVERDLPKLRSWPK